MWDTQAEQGTPGLRAHQASLPDQSRAAGPEISKIACRDQQAPLVAARSRPSTGPTACQTPAHPSQVQCHPVAGLHAFRRRLTTDSLAVPTALQKGWGWLQSTATGVKQHDWDRDKKVVAQ